jgi:hypothetical protein
VIDERADWNLLRELDDPAVVVWMEVGDQEVIDVIDAGVADGGHDTPGVAAVVARKTCVHEQRLASGRDDQSGLAAFDIDEVDVERLGRADERETGNRQRGDNHQAEFHHARILAHTASTVRDGYPAI